MKPVGSSLSQEASQYRCGSPLLTPNLQSCSMAQDTYQPNLHNPISQESYLPRENSSTAPGAPKHGLKPPGVTARSL